MITKRVFKIAFNRDVTLGNGEMVNHIQLGENVPSKFKGIGVVVDQKNRRILIKHKDWDYEMDLPLDSVDIYRKTDKRIANMIKAREIGMKQGKVPRRKK